jgi:hypothetical protein
VQEAAPLLGRPSSIVLNVELHEDHHDVVLWRVATRPREEGAPSVTRWYRVAFWHLAHDRDWAGALEDIAAGASAALAADVWWQQVLPLQGP